MRDRASITTKRTPASISRRPAAMPAAPAPRTTTSASSRKGARSFMHSIYGKMRYAILVKIAQGAAHRREIVAARGHPITEAIAVQLDIDEQLAVLSKAHHREIVIEAGWLQPVETIETHL